MFFCLFLFQCKRNCFYHYKHSHSVCFPSLQYQFALMNSFCFISHSIYYVKEDNTYHNKVNQCQCIVLVTTLKMVLFFNLEKKKKVKIFCLCCLPVRFYYKVFALSVNRNPNFPYGISGFTNRIVFRNTNPVVRNLCMKLLKESKSMKVHCQEDNITNERKQNSCRCQLLEAMKIGCFSLLIF